MKDYIIRQHIEMNNSFFRTVDLIKKIIVATLLIGAMSTLVCVRSEAAEITEQKASLELVNKINDLRTAKGEYRLVLDEELCEIAKVRAEEASEQWSHTRPNGKQGVNMIKGNVWKGENLSYATGSAGEVVDIMYDMLCDSPTHYDNMVFSQFNRIGVAVYETGGKTYAAYMFAS